MTRSDWWLLAKLAAAMLASHGFADGFSALGPFVWFGVYALGVTASVPVILCFQGWSRQVQA